MSSIDGILAHAGKRLQILLCCPATSSVMMYLKLECSHAAKYYWPMHGATLYSTTEREREVFFEHLSAGCTW